MLAYYFDQHRLPLPPGHRFPASKYGRLRERVEAEAEGITLREAPAAAEGELALAHVPSYIDDVLQGTLAAWHQREIGLPWSPALAERARRSVGATVAAARAACGAGPHAGVAASLGGGTHHAQAAGGAGYCVFNDVAVAARLMQAEWHRHERRLLQILVIDLDVHQGNGTASIFAEDETVFTFSMHGERNFPFRKCPGDLDVGLADGCEDATYLHALDQGLDEVGRRLAHRPPGLAFYVSGADAHEADRLGRLNLTVQGLAERDRRVLQWLGQRRIPAAVLMAGGYGRDIEITVGLHLQTLRLASEAHARWREDEDARRPRDRTMHG